MMGERNSDDSIPVGWTALENRLYRRDTIYDSLHWPVQPIELSKAIVAVSICGGPIALVPNEGWVGVSCALEIYSLSGHLLRRYERLREKTVPPSQVIALGWSANDLLSIVYNDGAVIRIPGGIHKNRVRITKVLANGKEERIYDAKVLQCGHIVLRGVTGAIFHVSSKDKVQQENVNVKPPEAVGRLLPRGSIASLQQVNNPQSIAETIFITETGNISCSNSNGIFQLPGDREVSQISISPNGQYLAAMESTSGNLFVTTADLGSEIARVNLAIELAALSVENVYSEVIFDPKKPVSIAWVGSDAIAVLYLEQIVLVGPHGGIAVLTLGEKFSHGGIVLHSETDGLRLLSSKGHDFIQMVAEPVHTVRCRKQSASYKLLKSCGSLEGITTTTSPEALNRYRLLRELRESGSLQEASRNCTAAAYLEVSCKEQKTFLQAAAYGQRHASVFADEENENLVPPRSSAPSALRTKMAEERSRREMKIVPTAVAILRVLNAASTSECGFHITKPQFDVLGLPALVARLSRFGRHTLAIRLATFGRISPYDVLAEWAIAALEANMNESDESVAHLIAERFDAVLRSYEGKKLYGNYRGRAMPYVVAAERAFELGKQKCAELLLGRETRPAPKVALYLRMGREASAIKASVSSGDPELVLEALGSVLERRNNSVHDFAKLLLSLPKPIGNRATDLFASYLKQIGDYKSLRKVYLEVGRRRDAALVEIFRADKIADPAERMAALEATEQSISVYSRRICNFEVQAVKHAAKAAASAIDLEKKGRLEPGTLRHANDGDLLARAIVDIQDVKRRQETREKLRKDLKIPDRRYFWICLDSMAEVGDFESIEKLSFEWHGRAPPIGLTAFVDTCIKYKMDDEAVKYALRISDLRDRARALARCGRGREAADIASRLRNNQLLEEVQDLAARHVEYITVPLGRRKD